MVKVYVDLIKKGKKTIEDVPKSIRKEVEKLLNLGVDDNVQMVFNQYYIKKGGV